MPGPWQPIGDFHSQWVLREPLTNAQALSRMDTDGNIKAVVSVELWDAFNDQEALVRFLDILEDNAVAAKGMLEDIEWRVVGHESPTTILVEVVGNVRNHLEDVGLIGGEDTVP